MYRHIKTVRMFLSTLADFVWFRSVSNY